MEPPSSYQTQREKAINTMQALLHHTHQEEKKDTPRCKVHQHEMVKIYCSQCQYLVCVECTTDAAHQGHKFTKIEDIIKTKQDELFNITENFRQILTTCMRDMEKVKQTEDRLDKETLVLKGLIEYCEVIQTGGDIELIQFVADAKKYLKLSDQSYQLNQLAFATSDVDASVKEIEALFCDLDIDTEMNKGSDFENIITTDVKIISNFITEPRPRHRKGRISRFLEQFIGDDITPSPQVVAAVSDSEAWVGVSSLGFASGVTQLFSIDGQVQQTLKVGSCIYDLAVARSGELLISSCNEPGNLIKLASNGKSIKLYEAPFGYCTRGITVTDNNCIIVCLYSRKEDEEHKLVHLSPTGKLMNIIQYDTDGKTELFKDPTNVSSNRNGDLIVTNCIDDTVVVVNKLGQKRFTYRGQIEGLKNPFRPKYSVTDQYGNILISDQNNSNIHLLNKNGKFVRFISIDKDYFRRPFGLSIDKSGRLWVSDDWGNRVTVIEYT